MARHKDTSAQMGAFNTSVALPNSMGLVGGAILIAGLYFGRDALIPLALAILVSFILTPIILAFRKIGVRSPVSVPIVMLALLAGLVSTGYVIAQQFTQFSDQLPYYEYNLREKVRAIKTITKGDTLRRASEALENLEKEMSDDDSDAQTSTPPQPAPGLGTNETTDVKSKDEPIKVKVEKESDGALFWIQGYLVSLVAPVLTFAITLIFATFILLQREDLRDRVIKLFGVGDLTRTTNAMNDAATRLGRYFFAQFVMNATYGAVMATVLSALGVPNAILWGFIAGLMRFVPYVGTLIAVAGPVLLALAVEPGWWLATLTLVIFLTAEFLMGQVVEPLVYGRNAGLSPLAVVASATFWTIIWGPIGLVLAVPITLILVTFGQYIDKLEFITVLLGNQPALTDDQKFYQRLLVGDHTELALQAEEFFSEGETMVSYFDRVAIPGLVRAQMEYRSGRLERAEMSEINETMESFLELLREFSAPAAKVSDFSQAEDGDRDGDTEDNTEIDEIHAGRTKSKEQPVLVLAGLGPIDVSSAKLIELVLEKMGLDTRVVQNARTAALKELTQESGDARAELVLISTVSNLSHRAAKLMLRRVDQYSLDTDLILCAWGGQANAISLPDSDFSHTATSFTDLLSILDALPADKTNASPDANGVAAASEDLAQTIESAQ